MHTPRRAPLSRWARILRLQALVALLGVLPALAASAERLQVAHSTLTATNAVLWVARDKGIFQSHGLDVRLIYVAGVRSLQALLANEVELVSVAGSTAIQANLAGADTVIVGGISNSVLMWLVVAPGITTAAGLRNGRLAVTRFGSLSDFMARTYLRRAGLTPDRDVALIQTGGYPESVAALQAGAIQAAMLSPPYHKIAMKRLGFRELVDLSQTMKYQSNALVTLRRFAQTQPAIVTTFLKSYVEAVRVFKQEREFTIGVLSRAMRTTDREILDDTYSFYRDYFEDIPHPTLEGVQLILDEMAPRTPRAREARPQDFVDLRFVQALEAARGKKGP
ncbi:MAG: ABC transporter substrate-binding protein [Deltaproteobacteria bacterium]|nr:ABC transporter substrate-binding protein [Deltaproteobacteria bacterium]MBI2181544.1 ABC transporter substrate-binding protein [Deltaproteobacteria bacterium]MBI2230163.1 ABC transporter substrate-binding protein [Deltaproteobacteria bacterium]MBI2366034.1 ABC transporter substrate-binding protein [Deltaproteobacteria bacterium]